MHKGFAWLLALAFAASGALTIVAINHLSLIDDLREDNDQLEGQVFSLKARTSNAEDAIEELEGRPGVDLDELASALAGLRQGLAGLSEEVDDLQDLDFRLGRVEYQIKRPFACRAFDAVYWASSFNGGFTC